MLWLVIAFPLLGAFLNGLVLPKAPKIVSHLIAVGAMLASFTCALLVMTDFMGRGGEAEVIKGFDWISAGAFHAPFSVILDRLSALMMLVVTGIGSLIHIYAGGYMHDEKSTSRFFAYLNLFVFMMLLLVFGDNMLVMFVGWEGVGLCSYLLIGYWFSDDANAAAGMKAFIVNRIGDIGFLLGIFLTFQYFGTISFSELRGIIATTEMDAVKLAGIGLITLAMFVGACGKSAQIPLYIWLPDAMAGPTPVSALIHAATMVTAGIYMMTRLNFMYYLAPGTLQVVAIVGGLTAFVAASIALVQRDIKKVLAYSTVSQLGYMVMACGVGAFGAGVFHLLTHACFKALLFLGAGSVIYAMHHKQDMFDMGGLRKKLPITHAVMLVGVLAIIGFPGLAGFFSKDEILWRVFVGGGPALWALGAVTAGLTSFYMVRMLCLTFYGTCRADHHTQEHLHETPPHMWGPLVILAILSATVGYFGVPQLLGGSNMFEHYLEPVMFIPAQAQEHWNAILHGEHSHALEWGLMGASVAIMVLASLLAITWYKNGAAAPAQALKARFAGAYNTLFNKYFVDEFYDAKIVTPLRNMAQFLWKIVDVLVIDGIVNGVGQLCMIVGGLASFRMTGSLHRHGMVLVVGMICLMSALLF